MKLESQVCSLELAKKLKELGVKQESFWCWYEAVRLIGAKNEVREIKQWSLAQMPLLSKETYSAFTVAELGEMLPNGEVLKFWKRPPLNTSWVCCHEKEIIVVSTEANARAKMLCWLIEKKKI